MDDVGELMSGVSMPVIQIVRSIHVELMVYMCSQQMLDGWYDTMFEDYQLCLMVLKFKKQGLGCQIVECLNFVIDKFVCKSRGTNRLTKETNTLSLFSIRSKDVKCGD
jgi:hypothetical protein